MTALRRPRWWLAVEIVVVAIVLFGAATLLFGQLGDSSLHDGDEALYATVAREMAQTHSWLTPTYWGAPFLHKPPLPYWLMMISSSVVPGTREFAARFPSAVAALLTLCFVYVSARRLAGVVAAILATCLLALNHQWLFEHAARSASFDALLTLLMFGALIAGLNSTDRRAWGIAAVVLLGAVAMVKAPMVIFPAFAIVLHAWLRTRRFPARLVLRGLAGILIVALPWHLYQLVVHHGDFWNQYVRYEIFGRMGDTVRDESAWPMIHLGATWWSFLPWSPLIAVALVATIAGWPRNTADDDTARADAARTLAIYAATILVFFCFVPAKWPWYSIPAYPALAVVTAVFLIRCLNSHARRVLAIVVAVLAVACAFWLGTNGDYAPVSRPSFQWPAHEAFYTLGHGAGGAFAIVAVITVIAAVLALLPFAKPERTREGLVMLTALGVMLACNWKAVRTVPQSHTSSVSGLASEVEAGGFARVYAIGFRHVPWYGNRLEPVSSYYLLGIRGPVVTDCGADLACLSDRGSAGAALVAWDPGLDDDIRRAITMRAAELSPALQTWVVQSPVRYYKLSPIATTP
jgi:4-amino-4-deoxy-L-arabinose transferase-like glycosyltransferase